MNLKQRRSLPVRLTFLYCIISLAVSTPCLASPWQTPAGKIIDTITCQADHSQSYALYIPTKSSGQPLPVIYFFDPHAAGAHPLKKYRSLADEYGFILVGSNNSKNGNDWPTTENIWRSLLQDTREKLKIDGNRIYTAGFSGGAKVASYIAIQHNIIKGVIVNGAGLPDGVSAGDFNFNLTVLAGEGDLNLTDLVSLNKSLDKSRTRHRIIYFDGIHEWAPATTMSRAFTGLKLDAMQTGLIPKDETFINRYSVKSKNSINTLYQSQQLIKAGEECKVSISFLDGLTNEASWFKEKITSLSGNTLYQKQQQAQENLLVREQGIKTGYMPHFQQSDNTWWSKTISDLRTGARTKTAERAMYQRLLAYLSLAFYSFSNQLINSNNNPAARHFIDLYKMADSTNSEAWYFSAILNAREGQPHVAENDLQRAVGYGFRDKDRLLAQPEFKAASGKIDLPGIERKMKAPLKEN